MTQPEPTPGTSKEILRAIRVFFGAIVTGALLFAVIVIALNTFQKKEPADKSLGNAFGIVSVVIAGGCFAAAWTGYNKGIAIAKDSLMPLTDKLNQYRSALIRYMAFCDMPALFGIIAFFVTGNYLTLGVTGLMLIAMLAKTPTKKRVVDELDFDWQQQQELE
jgi:uncharacterized integral membrane protein